MKRALFALLLVVVPVVALAQPEILWSRFFGTASDDFAYSLCPTADSGYALAGVTYAGGVDAWLIRTDWNGDSLWSRRYGGTGNQYCYSVDQCADGGYVMCGYTEPYNTGPRDMWVARANADGDTLWSRKFGENGENGDGAWSAHELPDGGFIVAGSSQVSGFWFIRTNAQGDSIWSRANGDPDPWGCYEAQMTTNGGFIMVGSNFRLIRLNAFGDSLWSRTYGNGLDRCMSGKQTMDGGFVLAGFMGLAREFAIVRTDSSGELLWMRTYHMGGFDACWDVYETADGGFALAGTTTIGGWENLFAAVFLKVSAIGDSLWSIIYDGPSDDGFMSVYQAVDGGYVLAGFSSSGSSSDRDVWLLKTLPDPILAADDPFIPHPTTFTLSNYPNPFNPTTEIEFELSRNGLVSLKVYDLLGREVAEFFNGMQTAGRHRVTFDGTGLASGVYLYRLVAGERTETRKMVLIR
jgi:hypothetical protein